MTQRLLVFNATSLDGYFTDAAGEMGFAYDVAPDAEFDAWTSGNASGGGALIFGRKTYELMVQWWPTPQAAQAMPVVAGRMNAAPKIVFSRTLKQASWQNTRLVGADLVAEMRRLKRGPGPDMVILGSASIVGQLAEAGLVDDYQIAVSPVVLGKGRSMFEAVTRKLALQLTGSRVFGNGTVVLRYRPAA